MSEFSGICKKLANVEYEKSKKTEITTLKKRKKQKK